MSEQDNTSVAWRDGHEKLYRIIFESNEGPSKVFDIALLITILVSIVAVLLESVPSLDSQFHLFFETLEWLITILFTIEYGIRLRIVRRPAHYAFSFFGIVDLLSILPTWIGFFFPALGWLQVVRALRLIRVFRILGLRQFNREASGLVRVFSSSGAKITVFMTAIMIVVIIAGALMFIIEGPERGFRSIPEGMYWAIVTMSTVGYGDIVPHTTFGRLLASLLILVGYSLIVVPVTIVTSETRKLKKDKSCARCGTGGHPIPARYCMQCGERFKES